MYIPKTPLWCLDLDEDEQYLSQPTGIWMGHEFLVCTQRNAPCIARCTVAMPWVARAGEPQGGWLIQCGEMAGLDAKGRHLCAAHMATHWQCLRMDCGAFLPHGEGGFCSEMCKALYLSSLDCEP